MQAVVHRCVSLDKATAQRNVTISGPLNAENEALRRELEAVRASSTLQREDLGRRLDEAKDTISHQRKELDSAHETIDDLKLQVEELHIEIGDPERGHTSRRRKVPRRRYRSTSPSLSRRSATTPLIIDDDVPSPAAPAEGATLASRLSDALPDAVTLADPAPAPIAAPSSTFVEVLGFHSLLPVLYFVNNVLTTPPPHMTGSAAVRRNGSSTILANGDIDLSAHPHYVLALSKRTQEGDLVWTTTLITCSYITSLPVMQCIDAEMPIPLGNLILGGRNGVLTSPQRDPTNDAMLDSLLENPEKQVHAEVYIKRIQFTPLEVHTDLHRRALQCWEEIEPELRRTQDDKLVEPSPHADVPAWKKWLKTMREHPKSKGKFKYIGIPQVGPGYIKAHIEGAQATTLFIPTNNKGIRNCGPLWDAILRAAAALLSVPQWYSRILGRLGLQIAEVRRKQQYDAARFGHENRLGLVQIARYLASIRFTEDEAEQLRPWAAAFLEMDLEEHPHSHLAEELQTAKVRAHEVIDADPDQVLKNIPADAPGYYNPRLEQNRATRRAHCVDHQAETNVSGNATAGPSSVTLDEDTRMNTIQLNYESNDSEDERMGPA